jgi:integrase
MQGQVLERRWKSGCGYALRFRAYEQRQYLTLGLASEGWTRKRAETELANILADVRRGTWIPPDRNQHAGRQDDQAPTRGLTFHLFASSWHTDREGQVAQRTHEYEYWALHYHLLPYFANWPLGEIDIEAVDGYRRYKVQQAEQRRSMIESGKPACDVHGRVLRPLSASSINKTINILRAILALALEYGHIPSNPAAGKRRRLKPPASRPVHLDTAEQIQALLDAAGELDRDPYWRTSDRRAIIATLILAGPRAHELCNLLWRDIDLANGRIHIGRSKTQAGLREIPLLPLLRDELAAHKASSYRSGPEDPVFPTGTGGHRDKDNLRNRILAAAITRAEELLAQREQTPLPKGLTPHKLRHTFASILVALSHDPASVMVALGHTDPRFTLRVYTHLMRRDAAERQRLQALVDGESLPGPASLASRVSPSPVHARAS